MIVVSARALLIAALCLLSAPCHASGPRWVTGLPYYYPEGRPIVWYTASPSYFTDAGDLSPYVDHAAANALVLAAASVWTVPTANFNLLYGGDLAEHVSLSNVYPTTTGIVFPTDVQSTNYLNRQIAVLYDSDGAITDLLLGNGASSPSSCRQNAVTESVDSISQGGKIQHALLVLNGRCTGPAPEQQLQLQYQLMRAFGRVIGLGWSQTNDNVFTGTPQPTIQQALHWPVMHPIDVICGPYTYQCMPQPFTLRDDDVSGLGLLYPVGSIVPSVPGKTDTLARANRVLGIVTFPNGQGMQGVNVVIHRLEPAWPYPEAWESTSAVSGALFRRRSATPINKAVASPSANMGAPTATLEGAYDIFRTPLYDWEGWQNLVVSTQPINPLYIGPYAVGPYDTNPVTPSGSSTAQTYYVSSSYGQARVNLNVTDAASACQAQNGTESAPSSVPAQGWWTGDLCAYGRTDWSTLAIKANRSLTLEVTAQDEHGLASSAKSLPVIGLWNATDATGTLPTIASTPSALNSSVTGMTTLTTQTSQPLQLRFAIMDQRDDGRPDFAYQARVLYADSISPSTIPSKGGATVTITGMGFRPGNAVSIQGVPASVTDWTSNAITAIAPALHLSSAQTVDVSVRDLATGGTTVMTSALTYQAPQPQLTLLSAPSGTVYTWTPASAPFTLKAIAADGSSPLPNLAVTLSATSGQVRFEACGLAACTLSTDASGTVTSFLTPLQPGPITLSAASSIGSVSAAFNATSRIQTITPLNPQLYLAEGAVITWNPQVSLSDNAASTVGTSVQWNPVSGPIAFNPSSSSANEQSIAQTTATAGPLAGQAQATATACAWTSTCATFAINRVSDNSLQIHILSGTQQAIAAAVSFAPVVLLVTDPLGHPVPGAAVTVRQTLEPWSAPCPPQGRCPIAPVYDSSTTTLISGLDGAITLPALEAPAAPGITRIAAATGTEGLLSLSLRKPPETLASEPFHPLHASHP